MISGRSNGANVTLDALGKNYGKNVVVDDVNLTIDPGEFMTFLGPSGSGKTTTLNMVAGFVAPDRGTISIDGNAVNAVPPRQRGIGMVFQNYALFPHMTAAANIEFPLKQRRIDKRQGRKLVSEALETVHLAGMENRYPSQLSGGQQQRVALARSIVFRPDVLLLDEPFGALDRALREKLQLELRRIHREVGTTVIFVTHDQEEALALSDRIAVFNHGRLEQVGTGTDLYEHPVSLFVANFIGDSTRLVGTVGKDGSETYVEYRGHRLACPQADIAAGGRAVLVIRPERLRLNPSGDLPGHHNAVEVQILEQIYLGAGRKVTIRLPDGAQGMVWEGVGQTSDTHPGDTAVLSWDREHSNLLPGEEPTDAWDIGPIDADRIGEDPDSSESPR